MNVLALLSRMYINLYIRQYLVRETELLYVLWMLDVLGEFIQKRHLGSQRMVTR